MRSLALASALLLFALAGAAFSAEVRMAYNGPPDEEHNAVHYFAVRFKAMVEEATAGRVKLSLFPDSQLGNEEERMDLTIKMPVINVASYAGMGPLLPELYAASVPFMFDSYRAAHLFFDESQYWARVKERFREKTGAILLEAVEEGEFLAFTNSKREIRSPEDFKGLRFRAMDEGQMIIYKAFGASGVPIPWTELYMALKTGVADGQMNPPTYIIIGSLYEVQKYMTMANIQYSDQFLVVNGGWFLSLSEEDRKAIEASAKKANQMVRQYVEETEKKRLEFLASKGMKIYHPTPQEMQLFREKAQPAYVKWLESRVGREWLDLALECAKRANEASR